MQQATYNATTNEMVRGESDVNAAQQARIRTTIANVNAGATLLPAVPGRAYRITDMTMIAVGGAVTGATDVRILGTRAAGSVALFVVAIAALTQSAVNKPHSANVTVLADGATYTALDVNTPITIGKTGGAAATATNVDVILEYALE
jgi:hypothetical protein